MAPYVNLLAGGPIFPPGRDEGSELWLRNKAMFVSENEGWGRCASSDWLTSSKAKPDDEESRLYELAAKDKSHGIGADGLRYELPGSERSGKTGIVQQLRGEEHSKELEAPQW